jgi:hypothetical protein
LIATPAEQQPIESGHSRNSGFGLLSGFGLRSSDFAGLFGSFCRPRANQAKQPVWIAQQTLAFDETWIQESHITAFCNIADNTSFTPDLSAILF